MAFSLAAPTLMPSHMQRGATVPRTRLDAQNTPAWIALDAARCWRRTRDCGAPIEPALFATLESHRIGVTGCGVLAPAFSSLMALYETCTGRLFRAARAGSAYFSDDEYRLLQMLAASERTPDTRLGALARPRLAAALRVALRSTQLMLRQAF